MQIAGILCLFIQVYHNLQGFMVIWETVCPEIAICDKYILVSMKLNQMTTQVENTKCLQAEIFHFVPHNV